MGVYAVKHYSCIVIFFFMPNLLVNNQLFLNARHPFKFSKFHLQATLPSFFRSIETAATTSSERRSLDAII